MIAAPATAHAESPLAAVARRVPPHVFFLVSEVEDRHRRRGVRRLAGALALGVVLALMNATFYLAIARHRGVWVLPLRARSWPSLPTTC